MITLDDSILAENSPMTVRQQYKVAAMQAFITHRGDAANNICQASGAVADAMIAEDKEHES